MCWFSILLTAFGVFWLGVLVVLTWSLIFGTRVHEAGHAVMIWAVPHYRPTEIGITSDRGYCSYERKGLTVGAAQSLASAAISMAGPAAEKLARMPCIPFGYGSDLSSALRDVRHFLVLPLASRNALLAGVDRKNMRRVYWICRLVLKSRLSDDELRGMTVAYEMALACLWSNWPRVRSISRAMLARSVLYEDEIVKKLGPKPRHFSWRTIRLS